MLLKWRPWKETLQELQMLSSVTLNCQVTKIVMNSDFQSSELELMCQTPQVFWIIIVIVIVKIIQKWPQLSKLATTKNGTKLSKLSQKFSGHVSSSLWTNVPKVTGLWGQK